MNPRGPASSSISKKIAEAETVSVTSNVEPAWRVPFTPLPKLLDPVGSNVWRYGSVGHASSTLPILMATTPAAGDTTHNTLTQLTKAIHITVFADLFISMLLF